MVPIKEVEEVELEVKMIEDLQLMCHCLEFDDDLRISIVASMQRLLLLKWKTLVVEADCIIIG